MAGERLQWRPMAEETARETALGVARARFVDSLPRKAEELGRAVELLAGTPDGARLREEMRRRLHALYASAQVFRIEHLAVALKDGIHRLDAAREGARALRPDELDLLGRVASALPSLPSAPLDEVAPPTLVPPEPHAEEALPAAADASSAEPFEAMPELEGPAASFASSSSPPSEPPPPPAFEPPSEPSGAIPPRLALPLPEQPSLRGRKGAGSSATPPASASDPRGGRPALGYRAKTTLQGLPVQPPPAPLPPPAEGPPRPGGSFTMGRRPQGAGARSFASPTHTIVSVLVLDRVESQATIRAALPHERFELLAASDPEEALRLARSSAPDVVLADRDLATHPGTDFIARLRSDPLTDFVPVVLLVASGMRWDPVEARESGADEVLAKPLDAQVLVRTVARLAGTLGDGGASFDALGDATLDDVVTRLAGEIRRGLVDSAESGRDLRIPMGEGTEVLAAAWAAVARLRAYVAQRSGGRVRFRDSPRRGGPALMALVDEGADAAEELATDVSLEGRRILVVDDDPAIVWFFAGLLREEGAEVAEAEDGIVALEAARNRRPDLIISDIVMPELDGFGLCRELQRDPALADVPVILLSWKEDFLQRMRELDAGAQGYLRKEAGSAQILGRVRQVLRPRARIEAQLRAGGEVRGRIEGLGVIPLLRTVAHETGNARVTLRDAWSLFEVDIRDGRLVDITRTASDGSFARGRRILPWLLGCTAGRFTIDPTDAPVRGTLDATIDDSLAEATRTLGAWIDAVSGRGLSRAAHVSFDADVLEPFLRTSPAPVRVLVERIRGGQGPRRLLLDGAVAPQALESVLVDLARRGALREVRGADGEDRVAEALRARGGGEAAPSEASGGRPARLSEPPTDVDDAEVVAVTEEEASSLDWLSTGEQTGDIVAEAHAMVAGGRPRRRSDSMTDLDAPFVEDREGVSPEEDRRVAHEVEAVLPPPPEHEAMPRPPASPMAPSAPAREEAPVVRAQTSATPPPAVDGASEHMAAAPKPTAPPAPVKEEAPSPSASASPSPSSESLPREVHHEEPATVREAPADTGHDEPAAASAPRTSRGPRVPSDAPPRPDAPSRRPSAEEEDAGPGPWVWFFILGACVITGFVGWRVIEHGRHRRPSPEPDPVPAVHAMPSGASGSLPTRTNPGPAVPAPATGATVPTFGQRLTAYDAGVTLRPGEGALVVEGQAGAAAEVQIRDRAPVPIPARVALPAGGPYRLAFRSGGTEIIRFVTISAGSTLLVHAPRQ